MLIGIVVGGFRVFTVFTQIQSSLSRDITMINSERWNRQRGDSVINFTTATSATAAHILCRFCCHAGRRCIKFQHLKTHKEHTKGKIDLCRYVICSICSAEPCPFIKVTDTQYSVLPISTQYSVLRDQCSYVGTVLTDINS